MLFTKRPQPVEAVQVTEIAHGAMLLNCEAPRWFMEACALPRNMRGAIWLVHPDRPSGEAFEPFMCVSTTTGILRVRPGDWIVQERPHVLTHMTPEAFAGTYQAFAAVDA